MRRAEQRLEVLGEVGLREEREDAAAVVVDDDERGVDPAVGGTEQAVAVVQEAEIAEQRDRRAVGAAPAMPSTVDTKPSMPFTPRLASTSRPSRGAAKLSTSRTGMLDATTSARVRRAPRRRRRARRDPRTARPSRRRSSSIAAARRRVGVVPRLRATPSSTGHVDGVGQRVEEQLGSATIRPLTACCGSSHAPSGSTSTWATSASSHCIATLLVSGPPRRSTTSGRCAAGERRRRAAAGRRSRPCPGTRRFEIGSASTGQPAASAKRSSGPRVARPRPSPRPRARAACRPTRCGERVEHPDRLGARTPGALRRPRTAVGPTGRVDERRRRSAPAARGTGG